MRQLSVIGKSAKRVDTSAKATGDALYTADLSLPRMLVGKVLRSPYAHARILRVDTSKAEELPGVRAVVTSADSSGDKWGVFRYTQDQAFLPGDKVHSITEISECSTCHGPGKQYQLKPSHPPKFECFKCHKLKK